MTPRVAIASGLVLFAGLGYGSLFAANKLVADAGFPAAAYLFWQSLLGAGALFALRLLSWRRPPAGGKALMHYGVSAAFGMLVPTGVLVMVADDLPAGVLTLTLTLVPAMTYLFAFVLGIERFRTLSVLAILLGFGGVLMIVLPQGSLPDPRAAILILPALIAPIVAAANNIIVATLRPPAAASLTLGAAVLAAGAVLMLPIALATGSLVPFWTWGPASLTGVLWAGAAQAIGFFCLYEVIRLAGPVFFAQVSYVIVVAGSAWGYVLFGERPSAWVWGAAVLMTLGLVLANAALLRKPRARAAA